MAPRLRTASIVLAGLLVTVTTTAIAQRGTAPASTSVQLDVTTRIVESAQALLGTLGDAGRAKVQFPFDGPQKARWSNLPGPMFQRDGLRMGDLTPAQRAAVMALLSVALSRDGYRKVTDIMRGDEVLRKTAGPGGARGGPNPGGGAPNPDRSGAGGRDGGGGRGRGMAGAGPAFGEDEYHLAFLGTPSVTAPWMLQFGGHHLAINLTLAGSRATMAPSLPAAQPATYTFEGQMIRPLGRENDKAFALINALDVKQRGQAVLGYRVSDLVLGPTQDGRTIQPEGIRASALTVPQQTMLWDLVREWAGIMNDAFADPRMAELRADVNDTYFAWSGPTTNGGAAYFRVQGPTLVIEYAPQNGVDHIHTIYRDPTNDYGAKFARRSGYALAAALAAAVTLGTAASAHRRNEYLQAARLAVEPGRVDLELDLTPGIEVAEAIIADIDGDRDGALSAAEQRAYLGRVLDAVVLEVDGRRLRVEPINSTFPGLDAFRRGEGTIRLQAAVLLPHQVDGEHQLAFRNMDRRDVSVYLANALVPRSDRVVIAAQRRDPAQRDLTIDYVLRPGPDTSALTWLLGGLTGAMVVAALLMRPSKIA